MAQQPEALRLADLLTDSRLTKESRDHIAAEAATELRRLHGHINNALKCAENSNALTADLLKERDAPRAQVERLQAACRSQNAESDPQASLSLTGVADERVQFFSYSSEGDFQKHSTADEAEAAINEELAIYRENAQFDDEWADEVTSLCWGVILSAATIVPMPDAEDERCDYKLPKPRAALATQPARVALSPALIAQEAWLSHGYPEGTVAASMFLHGVRFAEKYGGIRGITPGDGAA